jgi:hypothetical protein
MKPYLILATALALSATAAFAADGTFDRTLSVSGNPVVSVSTGSGYIHVSPGSGSQIHVVGHVHVHSNWGGSGDEESRVKQIVANPPIEQSGNTVTIGAYHGDSDLFRNVSIDYDVILPRTSELQAHSGSGDLQINNIEHTVAAGTGSGSIHLTGVSSGLRASTGSGSIEVAGNPTADWRISTGSGSVAVTPDPSAHFNLEATTGSGSVHADRQIAMQGDFTHHHVTGTVNGGGPTVHITTGSGSVTIH